MDKEQGLNIATDEDSTPGQVCNAKYRQNATTKLTHKLKMHKKIDLCTLHMRNKSCISKNI